MSSILDSTYAAHISVLGFPGLPGLWPMGFSDGFMCNRDLTLHYVDY
jgi:hypothetical protein